ncbi:ABC transporter ATP-binding protein/permease [Allonocardiopsis opalescens]|uniref:ABC-type multidrug transport system ATPase subunit n=1 Tax=Allonocardiopsis opalescens TaxID=1144618 RepID=A0A2T0PYF4_9ACTN|nr:ATP-binding cassette domain-containing protein [Allonocardiopsis opalescens]PRX96571.1 ABC-type multidrug transport system ATPase subunit [Allonocardiopsis opalescens]
MDDGADSALGAVRTDGGAEAARAPDGHPVVRMSAVSKNYGAVPGIGGLDLEVAAGETVALLGPNGAGKSTILNLLLGLRRPDRGSVAVNGHPPTSYAARSITGTVLQSSGLPGNLRVGELVALFRSYYPAPLAAEEAIGRAGIAELRDRYFGDLSGGQQQRVYIALALCARPKLLVLDEPSVGLDIEARARLRTLLSLLAAEGCAIVLATHDLGEAEELADRVVLVVGSRVVFDGRPGAITSMFTLRRVYARTRTPLEAEELRGYGDVSYEDGEFRATTRHPAELLRALLARAADLTDLEVRGASFEEAVTTALRDRAIAEPTPDTAPAPAPANPGPARRLPRRPEITARHWLRMAAGQTRVEFLKLWRDTTFVVITCLMPTIFFAFLGTSYGGGEGAVRGLASLSAYGTIGVGLFGFGVGIATERGMRWDQLTRATPMRVSAYFAAKLIPAACFAVLTLGLLAGYAVTVADVSIGWWVWVRMAGGLTGGSIVFIALGLAIGYNLSPRAAMPFATVVYLPLSLASGLLIPTSQLPSYLQVAAELLPAWHYARISWTAVGAGPEFGAVSALVLTAYTGVFLVLAATGYRRELRARFL